MGAFTLAPTRFAFTGIQLSPADLLAPGKLPYVQNVRSYEEGTLVPRDGLDRITTGGAVGGGVAIHTLSRLNDPRPDASQPALRVIGAGTQLYANAPGSATFPSIDTGYSGDPLTTAEAVPVGNPQPFLYIGDRTRSRKVAVDGTDYAHGLPQPTGFATAPTALLQAPLETLVSELDTAAAWAEVGGIGGGLVNQARASTTISAIVYDSGTDGYASIGATSMAEINPGMHLRVAAAETVLVTDVLVAIASTTIGAIIYDSGATGACTIQPVGSLGVGQLEGPSYQETVARHRNLDQVPEAVNTEGAFRVTRIRQIDFPVNCLVRIDSGGGSDEVVRITSVAIGTDGIQSFRCVAANTHAAAETLDGIAGFRAATTGTRAATDALLGASIRHTLTTVAESAVVAGIGDTTLSVDLAQVSGTRPTLPEDGILFSLRVDLLRYVTEVRLYLDVDLASPATFLSNYYLRVWRASDIVAAIQDTNAAVTDSLLDAKTGAVLREQVDDTPVGVDGEVVGRAMPRDAGSPARSTIIADPENRRRPLPDPATPVERQLSLGNNQWLTLRTRIQELLRIGNDPARTLADVGGVQILLTFEGRTGAFVVDYGALLLTGGFGPDVGRFGVPYLYTYRYRSTLTGAVSNPAPATLGGVVPRRQRVALTGTLASDSQIDLVDWFRRGSTLVTWSYVGTSPNSGTPSLIDDEMDRAIEGGDQLRFDQFQPWPLVDSPATGVVDVAGTAITRVSGDTFDTNWAPGTQILVNGRAATLYASPVSASLLHVVENLGSASSATWDMPAPLLLAQPLPAIWYGLISGVPILFACGNTRDPGALVWCFGNNPEVTSDAHWLSVAGTDEALLNGFVHEGVCFAFSDRNLYQVLPAFGAIQTFTPRRTRCGRGLAGRWAWTLTPLGVCFVADDGIYLSAWGAPAVSLTSPDLQDLFPHDGTLGQSINGIDPPNMTSPADLRLEYVDGFIYFDYLTDDSPGTRRTLVYEQRVGRWFYDQYDLSAIRTRLADPGEDVHAQILGASNGHLYQYDSAELTDDGTAIAWVGWTHWPDANDPRGEKLVGDALLDVDPQGSDGGITVVPVYNSAQTVLGGITVGAGDTGRQQYPLDLVSGDGVLARNFGLRISGSVTSLDTARPVLYAWVLSWVPKIERALRRATDWMNLGIDATKQIRGLVVRAHTFGVAKAFDVEIDGAVLGESLSVNTSLEQTTAFAFDPPLFSHLVRLAPTDADPWLLFVDDLVWTFDPKPELVALTHDWTNDGRIGAKFFQGLVVHADTNGAAVTFRVESDNGVAQETFTIAATTGEDGIPFSFATPFIGHVVRIVQLGAFRLLNVEWIWEPTPEAALRWETQETTHDLPGYLTVRDGMIAYANATADITWTITYSDGGSTAYTLGANGGAYTRLYVPCVARKGNAVQYTFSSSAVFQLFQKDCSVRIQGWGQPGGLRTMNPFGGLSRERGARI